MIQQPIYLLTLFKDLCLQVTGVEAECYLLTQLRALMRLFPRNVSSADTDDFPFWPEIVPDPGAPHF